MTGVDQFMAAIFKRETLEFKRAVEVGKARGWLWKVATKPEGRLRHPAKKNAPTVKGRVRRGR